jgi:hypothetical protein
MNNNKKNDSVNSVRANLRSEAGQQLKRSLNKSSKMSGNKYPAIFNRSLCLSFAACDRSSEAAIGKVVFFILLHLTLKMAPVAKKNRCF